jgi:plastocyanin
VTQIGKAAPDRMRRMRRLLAAAAVSAGLTAVGAAPAPAAPTVRVGDNWFSPKTLTVARHSTVTWRFVGDRVHKLKVTRGPQRFKSPARSSGKYVRHMMYRGTYRIVCAIHEGSQKMTLKVD